MATKVNKNFVLVVTGFVLAASALLVGAALVYNNYRKDAERHIVAGDRIMAEAAAITDPAARSQRYRDAFNMYGRAVTKKPDNVDFIAKMEEALANVVATTATHASEDYRNLLMCKEARTRAQPEDPDQWLPFLRELERRADLLERVEFWKDLADRAGQMKQNVASDPRGVALADMYQTMALANDDTLSDREREENVKRLEELTKVLPGEWRVWKALVDMQREAVQTASRRGQTQVAAERLAAMDARLAEAGVALAQADADAQVALACMDLERLGLDTATGRALQIKDIDPMKLQAALTRVAEAAGKALSTEQVLAAASRVTAMGDHKRALAIMDAWVEAHPNDLRARATSALVRGQLAQADPSELDALRTAATQVIEQPQLPTSLDASMQQEYRSAVLSALLNAELLRVNNEVAEDKREEALTQLDKLRAQLLAAAQNDDSSPLMLAADAKLAYVRKQYPEAQAKWQAYFAKLNPFSIPADSYYWAVLTARARGENGLALQWADRGAEVHPRDIQLALQRAQLNSLLGRTAEAAALWNQLREVFPDNQQINDLAREYARIQQAQQGNDPLAADAKAIQDALEAKDYAAARAAVNVIMQKQGDSPAVQAALARIAMLEGNLEECDRILAAALAEYPRFPGLWQVKAERMSPNRADQIAIMVDGIVEDPKRRPGELLNAYRMLQRELNAQYSQLVSINPQAAAEIKGQLEDLAQRMAKVEQQAQSVGQDDPVTLGALFDEAISAFQRATQENRTTDAQEALGRARTLLEAARRLPNAPELPIVMESSLLEAQGQFQQALALVEKARAEGRTEARVAVRLASLLERVGREPAAFEVWKDAYERRPGDVATVLGYTRALGRQGRGAEAIGMLRAAVDVNPGDPRLGVALAQFEQTYGSRARAIEVREDMLGRQIPVPDNAAMLYSLLYMPPSVDGIRGTDGRILTAGQWGALTGEQRTRLLNDESRRMQTRAEEIYRDAMKANPLDIGLAAAKARVMREHGRPAEGTRAIQEVIDAAKARGTVPSTMYLELGQHLLAANRSQEANEAFRQAREVQDPTRREADLAVAEIEAQRGRTSEAVKALMDYAAANPRMEVLMRLCELQLTSGEFDAATQTLERARSAAGAQASVPVRASLVMLEAGIAAGRAEMADRAGNLAEGRQLRERAIGLLNEAEKIQPTALVAPLRRIGVLRQMAKAGGSLDRAVYDMAVAEADRLLSRNAAIMEVAMARTALALDRGDREGAIGVLERFLVAQPQDDSARNRLIQLYLATDAAPKALALARTAADAAPTRADRRERLGDLLAMTGDHAGAAAAYERAFQVQPDAPILLARAMDERIEAKRPEAALQLQQSAPADAQANPAVRAAQAVALQKMGRTTEAVAVAREAINGARAAGVGSPAMQQVLARLRMIYPPDKTKDLEELVLSQGAPSAVDKVLLAGLWMEAGEAHLDDVIRWTDAAIAEGDAIPPELMAVALTTRGNALYAKKDVAGALRAFQEAADQERPSPGALNNAAYVAAEAGLDLDRARRYAERAVALAPESPEFLDTLGYVLYLLASQSQDTKQLAYAEAVLQRSLLMEESAVAWLHLGKVQVAAGRPTEARRSYEKALELAERAARPDEELIKKIREATQAL